jgi:hypothetical protein
MRSARGSYLLFVTPASSPTGRNLAASGRARVGIGPTRDVVMVEGAVETVQPGELTEQDAELRAAKTGFDPRRLGTPYLCFRVVPRRVQAWREGRRARRPRTHARRTVVEDRLNPPVRDIRKVRVRGARPPRDRNPAEETWHW